MTVGSFLHSNLGTNMIFEVAKISVRFISPEVVHWRYHNAYRQGGSRAIAAIAVVLVVGGVVVVPVATVVIIRSVPSKVTWC